jgi:hypothetical protein
LVDAEVHRAYALCVFATSLAETVASMHPRVAEKPGLAYATASRAG